MARLPVSSLDVSQENFDWFNVVANLNEASKRDLLRQVVEGHLTRWRRRHIAKVEYFAKRNRLTWEQSFRLLADSDRKPPYKEEDFDWARNLPEEELWLSRDTAERSAVQAPNTDSYKSPET